MNESAYFISDIHLGSEEEPNAFLLLKFLDQLILEKPKYLFLLGDIFDLWVADHNYFIRKFEHVIEKIKRLHELGTEIHYFEGNHDLYLNRFFKNKLGWNVYEGPLTMRLWSTIVRIEHGDQMDPDDKGYLFLRSFLRSSFMTWLAPRLPEKVVVGLGNRSSAISREYTSSRADAIDSAVTEKALIHARELAGDFDVLVAGHVHVRIDEVFKREDVPGTSGGKNVRVLNLGTWLKTPVALKFSSDGEWKWLDLK